MSRGYCAKKFPEKIFMGNLLFLYDYLYLSNFYRIYDMIIHGNPPHKYYEAMQNSILLNTWMLAGYVEPLKQMPYPNEIITRGEIAYLIDMQATVDSNRQAYNVRIDRELMTVWSEYLDTLGVSVSAEELQHRTNVYDPLITYLKLWYNRPRPFQMAGIYNMPLYPFAEEYFGEAAYPSGHTFMSALVAHYITLRHPELKSDVWRFAMDVKRSREEYGVHYPSDGLFALQVFKVLKPLWFTQ